MNRFKDNITDPDFWLRLLYTLLFALVWQVVELLLGIVLIVQILFRLFSGEPQAKLAGFGNSLSQYAWQMGRYVTGASELKPWPFIDWPAADVEWQPCPPQPQVPTGEAPVAGAAAAEPPVVAPEQQAESASEPPLVQPQADDADDREHKP